MTYFLLLFKLLCGFVALLTVVRLLGKKELAATSPLDIVYSVALGDLIVDAAYDPKVKIPELFLGVAAWSLFIWLADLAARKWSWFDKLSNGKAEVIIYEGQIDLQVMKKHRLTYEEVRSLLRQKDVFSEHEVKMAVMETNGNLTVLKNE